jgi:hypothetical protein
LPALRLPRWGNLKERARDWQYDATERGGQDKKDPMYDHHEKYLDRGHCLDHIGVGDFRQCDRLLHVPKAVDGCC